MSVSSARHGVGVLFVFLSVTQLIAVLVRVKHKTSVFPDPTVGWYAAGILTTGFFAVTILTQPLIPLDEERYINWEYEQLARRPDFDIIRHRGMYIAGGAK